jgi:hypothetical protein
MMLLLCFNVFCNVRDLGFSVTESPKPSCHENLPITRRFSFIHSDELRFTSAIKSDGAWLGDMLTKA